MKNRRLWIDKLETAWRQRNVLWLSGVRRVGKTTLCQSLPDIEYLDCELPRTRQRLADPEAFLPDHRGKRIVLDEIHRLADPAQLLKIAADHFRDVRIVATGSSTLGASAKFRDTLAGRKAELWLTPMIAADLTAFANPSIAHRCLHGGLPPFFLASDLPHRDFQEWMDAYWAKDIQELFRLERRHSFQTFVELLLSHSGSMFEATRYSRPCEISRTTVSNYLAVLEATFVVHVLRPFTTRRATEIVAAPKVYGFDTGFVCHHRGWDRLRRDDMGPLWEHLVLNELHAHLQSRAVGYWRDKQGHEIDFVLSRRRKAPIAIECKWSAEHFDHAALAVFRKQYPQGENYLVANDVSRPYRRRVGELEVRCVGLAGLIAGLTG
ncbi:MAG: ATP-binding protein [Chromatiales bacterium]